MPAPLGSLVALVIAVAAVAGCATDRPQLKTGACLAKESLVEGESAPDLASIVPCTSQHRYEVYDVMDLPEGDDLARVAREQCLRSLLRVTGYAAVKVNGKSAVAVDLIPAMKGIQAPRFVVMPGLSLVDDRRQVVCLARTTVPVQAGIGGGLLVAVAKTSAFPVTFRVCRGYDAERRNITDVPCSVRHVSESLFVFDAEKALGRRLVADILKHPTARRFDELDKVCTQALPQLLGRGFDKELRGFGRIVRHWRHDSKPVRCDVGPIEFRTSDLPAGSLVSTQALKVELVKPTAR